MSEYRLFETADFKKANKALAQRRGRSLEQKLTAYVYPQLRQEPHYGPNIKRLLGYDPSTWRYRIGEYRIFYLIDEKAQIAYILAINDRKETCR